MSILQHAFVPVQPSFSPDFAPWLGDEPEPFQPSAADFAFDLGFRLARDGEPFQRVTAGPFDPEIASAFSRGAFAGRRARDLAEAFELGRALGLETEISEPPAGFTGPEKAAYRRGFAEGKAEFEADRDFEAWVDEVEDERMELAFGCRITDADMYRSGCVS